MPITKLEIAKMQLEAQAEVQRMIDEIYSEINDLPRDYKPEEIDNGRKEQTLQRLAQSP